MKKSLLWIAAFVLVLTSCQESDIIENVDDGTNQLSFAVYQGKATKTGELTNDKLKQTGVKLPLYAYKGVQSGVKTLYFNDTLSYSTKWGTSITRFLTDKDPLQFYAYYPVKKDSTVYDEANALDAAGFPTLTHSIGATDADRADLIAAKITDHTGTDVVIPMRHILSQVNFGVKGYDDAKIEIRNIVVNNVVRNGIFNFGTWAWGDHTTPAIASYDYIFANETTALASQYQTPGIKGDGSNTYIFGDGGKGGPGIDATTKYVTGTNPGDTVSGDKYKGELTNSLILMPQTLLEGMSNAYTTFEYRISDMGTPPAWVVGGPRNVVGTDWIVGQFDLNFTYTDPKGGVYSGQWSPNFRYLYLIDFTDYLDGQKLTFDVDVDTQPWENYNQDGSDDGIIYLSSLGEPIFRKYIQKLPVRDSYIIPEGNVFSNVVWNWSYYTMADSVFTDQGDNFTVDFSKVKFNGNKITVTPPIGFTVNNQGVADADNRILTFTVRNAAVMPDTKVAVDAGVITTSLSVLYEDQTWDLEAPNVELNAGESFTVDASNVWLNGSDLTVVPPAGYILSGAYPKYKITKE